MNLETIFDYLQGILIFALMFAGLVYLYLSSPGATSHMPTRVRLVQIITVQLIAVVVIVLLDGVYMIGSGMYESRSLFMMVGLFTLLFAIPLSFVMFLGIGYLQVKYTDIAAPPSRNRSEDDAERDMFEAMMYPPK